MLTKRIAVSSLFMIFILLLQVKFFYLLPISSFYSINSNQQQILMVVIVVIGILPIIIAPRLYKMGSFSVFIKIFIIYYLFELVFSAFKTSQGLLDSLISSDFYLMLLFYFFVLSYITKGSRERFYKIIISVSSINIIICWLQYILSFRGIYFTQLNVDNMRFGSIRIPDMGETMTCAGILLCLILSLDKNKKKRWLYFCIVFIGILGNLFVSKGRITLIALFISGCIIFILKYKKNMARIIAIIITIILALIIFFQTPMGNSYLNSMDDKTTDTGSVRSREIDYYNNQTKDNLIFGVGFIRDKGETDNMSNYLKGPAHQYSRTDIGIWGLANTLGLVGVLWYIVVNLNLLKKIAWLSHEKQNNHYLVIVGLTIFSIIYIPTMIMLNPYSITVFSILLALVDRAILESKFAKPNF